MRIPTFQPNVPTAAQSGGLAGSIAGAMNQAPQYQQMLNQAQQGMIQNQYMSPLLQQMLIQQQQKAQQMQAQTKFAPQYYGGQAAIEQGVGQQELGKGAYANPQAFANLQQTQLFNKYFGPQTEATIKNLLSQAGLNTSQSKNVLQNTAQMPYELGLLERNAILQHPKSAIAMANNASPYGPAFTNFSNNLMNIPGLNANAAANFAQNTAPYGNNNKSTGAASQKYGLTAQQVSQLPIKIKNGKPYHYDASTNSYYKQ